MMIDNDLQSLKRTAINGGKLKIYPTGPLGGGGIRFWAGIKGVPEPRAYFAQNRFDFAGLTNGTYTSSFVCNWPFLQVSRARRGPDYQVAMGPSQRKRPLSVRISIFDKMLTEIFAFRF